MMKAKNEVITVEQEPMSEVFAASHKTLRTPPQQHAHPSCQQGHPSPSAILDFSITENELMLDGQENKRLKQLEKADIVQALHNIREKVQSIKTKSQSSNAVTKDQILEDLDNVINAAIEDNEQCEGKTHLSLDEPVHSKLMHSAQIDATNHDRIAAIESDLQEIKAVLKDALGAGNKEKT